MVRRWTWRPVGAWIWPWQSSPFKRSHRSWVLYSLRRWRNLIPVYSRTPAVAYPLIDKMVFLPRFWNNSSKQKKKENLLSGPSNLDRTPATPLDVVIGHPRPVLVAVSLVLAPVGWFWARGSGDRWFKDSLFFWLSWERWRVIWVLGLNPKSNNPIFYNLKKKPFFVCFLKYRVWSREQKEQFVQYTCCHLKFFCQEILIFDDAIVQKAPISPWLFS